MKYIDRCASLSWNIKKSRGSIEIRVGPIEVVSVDRQFISIEAVGKYTGAWNILSIHLQ
jgi:hypothetical protein